MTAEDERLRDERAALVSVSSDLAVTIGLLPNCAHPTSRGVCPECIETAVLAWLAERLGEDDVREAARVGVCRAMGEPQTANEAHSVDREQDMADAALAAVKTAIGGAS